jgi:radical SAM family uncharacterized protein
MLSKDLLLSVMKPARYIGHEIGLVKKDLTRVAVKVCLCFPDTYEIGMSHLGLRVLYNILNRRRDCAAERVFCPWLDMEERLKSNQLLLSSLESGSNIKDFDILGFSLPYELNYTNVLNILSLSGIPLEKKERNESHPLVVAGGPCCLNPEPMVDFIDCFVIGEGEEVINEIIEVYKRQKNQKINNRGLLLESLSRIAGVYVPSLKPGNKRKIAKRFVKDLNRLPVIDHWIVPYIEIVHDRIGIEIMRGCPNGCCFCQARAAYHPRRFLNERTILKTVRQLYKKTGYEEISLLSLSSSDHPQLNSLVRRLSCEFRDKGVSISLPSLRAKHQLGEISKIFSTMKKTTLTFAPEAGSERLRRFIRKNIDIDELFSVVRQAYQAGYRALKLYFMIGLPTETEDDLKEIVELCQKLALMKKEVGGPPAQLKVSISNFIPKPHTPFQWEAMATPEELLVKQAFLKHLFKKFRGYIHPTFHEVKPSTLEGVLARGDSRLGAVILEAFSKGARFDAWNNCFNFSLWNDAFFKCSIDPKEYLKEKNEADVLCWDFIDTGLSCQRPSREGV